MYILKKVYRINDIGTVCGGGTPSTTIDEFWDGDIPWVSPDDLSNYNKVYISNGKKYITELGLSKSSTKLLPKNTLLFSSRAPIGYIAISLNPICTNQGFKSIITNEKVNVKYLYYWIKCNLEYIKMFGSGSTFPEISGERMKKIKILIDDSVAKQEKIADILYKYDCLIEKNNRKIAILEEQIQELYKEWFVRFRFPGYEKAEFVGGVPKDWKFEKFGERYNITIGKTPPREETNWFTKNEEFSIDWSSIADIRKGMFLQRTSEQLTNEAIDRFHIVKLPKRTILLSFKLTVGLVAITTQEFTATNEAIAHFICQQSELEYLYMFLKNYDYNRLGNTSSIGNAINSKIIRKMNLVVPTKKVLELFHNKSKCMFDEIEKVQIINSKIEIIRDSLLPRLMSGKLEVKG